jgi:hypothetical protein
MTFARLFAVAVLGWLALVLAAALQTPSHAQSGPGNPELPYVGLTTTDGAAFQIVNASDGAGYAIQGSGPIGVHGRSKSQGTDWGVGVMGIGGSPDGIGVLGRGRRYGIAGMAEGLAAIAGKIEMIAAEDYRTIKAGELMSPTFGLLATRNVGVRGVVSSAIVHGSGVMGVFVDNTVDSSSAPTEYGVNRGFLGTRQSGVQGESESRGGFGVAGKVSGGPNAVAVYGDGGAEGFAGFFEGKVTIKGAAVIDKVFGKSGLVAGPGKFFKIDHPLDPATKFLMHASVESTERKNIYDGLATLDESGSAWVTLPAWFEALNSDFRYQLTCVGGYAQIYVAEEIRDNRFRIAGGRPGLRVSWQVTGVRQDAVARAHPFNVEEDKAPAERGKYLYPEELGLSSSLGIYNTGDPAAKPRNSRRSRESERPVPQIAGERR